MSLFAESEIVIIGGGAIGCGVAYSLAKAGQRDVLVLEREADVGRVTTAQGAGLCGQVRSSVERVRLAMHSVHTFRELQRDVEARPDWHEVGSIRLAFTPSRVQELRGLQAVCEQAGLEVAPDRPSRGRAALAAARSQRRPGGALVPLRRVHDAARGGAGLPATVPSHGRALRDGDGGHGITCRDGRVAAVRTDRGEVRCRMVVDAAGAHASHVARLAGLGLPIVPVRHEYYDTVPLPGLNPDLPCFRIPEMTLYGRATGERLRLGGWEANALSIDPRGYRLEEPAPVVAADQRVLDGFEEEFARLLPESRGAARTHIGKGWPTFTPDGRFIIGESRRVKGFVMAGGCNAHGISGSAGIGRLLVESLFDPHPSDYVGSLSPDRFTERPWRWDTARRQARHVYETYYALGG